MDEVDEEAEEDLGRLSYPGSSSEWGSEGSDSDAPPRDPDRFTSRHAILRRLLSTSSSSSSSSSVSSSLSSSLSSSSSSSVSSSLSSSLSSSSSSSSSSSPTSSPPPAALWRSPDVLALVLECLDRTEVVAMRAVSRAFADAGAWALQPLGRRLPPTRGVRDWLRDGVGAGPWKRSVVVVVDNDPVLLGAAVGSGFAVDANFRRGCEWAGALDAHMGGVRRAVFEGVLPIEDLASLSRCESVTIRSYTAGPLPSLAPLATVPAVTIVDCFLESDAVGVLAGVPRLDLGWNCIDDAGVDQLGGHESLVLDGNPITCIPAALGRVCRLSLCDINAAALPPLPHVETLLLRGFVDLSTIPKSLRVLVLTDAGLTDSDLAPLGSLCHLERLDLAQNLITDADPVKHVASINLAANPIAHVGALGQQRVLNLSRTRLEGRVPELGGVRELNLSYTKVSSTAGLEHVQALQLAAAHVEDFDAPPQCRELDLSWNLIEAASAAALLRGVHRLRLCGVALATAAPLRGIPHLDLSQCRALASADGLGDHISLSLDSSGVADLSGLGPVQDLDVSSTEITTVEPLVGVPGLRTLRATFCLRVQDWGCLGRCRALRKVVLVGSQVAGLDHVAAHVLV